MKFILIPFFLLTSLQVIGQSVTYENIIGTSWEWVNRTGSMTMKFKFIDSTHISQTSWDARYQPVMETVIGFSLNTTKKTTLLNVEWEGEILDCTTCSIRITGNLLIIENVKNSEENNPETKKKQLIFKKVI